MKFGERVRLATPLPATWMSNVIIHNVYIKFYTDVIGLEPKYIGWLYLAFNIWNVLNDPVIGVWLDRKRAVPGRGKLVRVMRNTVPWMIVMLALMAWTSPDWSQHTIFLVLLLELFIFDVAATVYLISATSHYYLYAPSTKERVQVEVVRQWIGNGVSFIATVVATQLLVGDLVTERTTIAVILMGVVAVNALVYLVAVCRLRNRDPDRLYDSGIDDSPLSGRAVFEDLGSMVRMRAFWVWFLHSLLVTAPMGIYFTAFLYFMDHVIRADGWQATVADVGSMLVVLALMPLVARLVSTVGVRMSLWIGAAPYLAGLGLLFFATTWWQVLLCYLVLMFGRYVIATASVAVDALLVDDNEQRTGTRKTGQIAAMRAILGAPVTGVQLVIYMSILGAYGYEAGASVQSESAQLGIRVATALVPIAFCLASLIPLLFLPYNRQREAELTEFSLARREVGGG
ncbi:MFS transporter [Tessaracoccus massiliensis]|uniref:MFS transporter n=1 Tax=Tessaracoccus massiliensis TaxID=1522311 RepID=UPI00058C8E77|nr:MFS transporter [Tessaracoccus massiliensis]